MCNKFHYLRGGAERYLFSLSESLKRFGCNVAHFSMQHPSNIAYPDSRYFVKYKDYSSVDSVRVISKIKMAVDLVYSSEAKVNIESLVADFKPTIVHLHNIYHQLSPSILHVFRSRGIPVVMTVHDYKLVCPNYKLYHHGRYCQACLGGRYINCVRNRCVGGSYTHSSLTAFAAYMHDLMGLYKCIDFFIVPSRFLEGVLSAGGVPKGKLVYLPHAIDLGSFQSADANLGEFILYVGSISEEKGLVDFLDTLIGLDDIPVKIAGDGHLLPRLEQITQGRKLTNIEFLGRLSQPQLADVIKAARFLVVPSRWPEPCGLVVYEAFAAGKPVVAAKSGGLQELVEDGQTGFFFEPGDRKAMALRIRWLWDNPYEVAAMGRRARSWVNNFNNQESHRNMILSIYRKALESRAGL